MRPAPFLTLLVLLPGSSAAAEDARVPFLVKQLASSRDARLRAQTVLLLGQTGSPSAVAPLCQAMADVEPLVRAAAANALGELRLVEARSCLTTAQADADAKVRTEVARALGSVPVGHGALYVSLEPVQDRVGTLSSDEVDLAARLARDRLGEFNAVLAPPGELKKAASALVKARNLKAYQLRLQLLPGTSERALKVEMLVMTYPDQALKGTWNVKAAGAKPESLIKVMVPRVIDDAAADLAWRTEDK